MHLSHISQTSKIVLPFIYYSYLHTITIKMNNLLCWFLVIVIYREAKVTRFLLLDKIDRFYQCLYNKMGE